MEKVKKIIKGLTPYGIVRLYQMRKSGRTDLEKILKNLQGKMCVVEGEGINSIIDVGASDGRWSLEVMEIFPVARYFLIEANHYHKDNLDKFVNKHKNTEYIMAAAGDRVGNVYFDDSDPFGGIAMDEKINADLIQIQETTIDYCVKDKKLKGPFLIKLDVHGFEVPIIKGALETLKETEIIVMEAYNFQIAKDSLLFHEMCEYMKEKGFRVAGIIDVSYRPKDYALWQMDLIFVKSTREEFLDNTYRCLKTNQIIK